MWHSAGCQQALSAAWAWAAFRACWLPSLPHGLTYCQADLLTQAHLTQTKRGFCCVITISRIFLFVKRKNKEFAKTLSDPIANNRNRQRICKLKYPVEYPLHKENRTNCNKAGEESPKDSDFTEVLNSKQVTKQRKHGIKVRQIIKVFDSFQGLWAKQRPLDIIHKPFTHINESCNKLYNEGKEVTIINNVHISHPQTVEGKSMQQELQ